MLEDFFSVIYVVSGKYQLRIISILGIGIEKYFLKTLIFKLYYIGYLFNYFV